MSRLTFPRAMAAVLALAWLAIIAGLVWLAWGAR